jgi:hypothetical protein
MKRFIPGGLIFITIIILSVFSCSEGSCFEETESYLKATFYLNETKKAIPPELLSLHGVGMDTVFLYNNSANVKVALIPLNSSAENSKFIITINNVADTLEFRYSSYPHLISKECGYTFYHHLEDEPICTHHVVDSIFVANKTITNLNVENIRIYY